MRIWRQITHESVERGRQRGVRPALVALVLALAFAPVCRGATTPDFRNFDHITTSFELLGQHRNVPCEACHANALFKGTPTACGACHGIGTAVRATAKPASHILSTDQCQACHTPWAWNPAVDFDHTQALGSCSTCHNGVQAQGKGPTHIVTDLECDVCHTTLSWAGAVFSHVGVTTGCAACHDGVHADGMVATHFPIGAPPAPCEGCHSTTNFTTFAGTVINHAAVTAMACGACHETANYLGMHPSTNTAAGDSRPNATLDSLHPTTGDCGQCHDTLSFAGAALKPPNHIPTTAPCIQCHTNPAQNSQYSVTGVHQGVSGCVACHGPTVATTFINVTIVTTAASHMPIGSLDCNGSGCHSTANVNPGGFVIGAANISNPTLTVAGHATVAGAVPACQTCHETAPYTGMLASTATAAGDSRPSATLDAIHPATGDCGSCHTTTPSFATDATSAAKPSNHIPTTAPCAQCHTTAGNNAVYSVTGTHQGVTGCLTCHGPSVATTFANVTIVSTSASHFPIGALDCNGSGCHSTANVNPGGFVIGTANVSSPTLTVAGHATIAGAVPACQTCHETAPYTGMLASTATTAGDSRPTALDKNHPTTGDCSGCHTTTPTFANDQSTTAEPANHIPTTAPCAQCHTTAGNDTVYSVTGTHQGVTGCLTCHGPSVATTFANVTIVTTPANHLPIGTLDCNGSGCHSTGNVNPGGFLIGAASTSSPTLTVAGHTTVAAAVPGCQSCHETAPYMGMIASTATVAGDSRPSATLDAIHPTTGDCGGCHTTTPTFVNDQTGAAMPANHIPTTAPCAQCHTTPGNNAVYSVTGVHTGVTGCLTCHGPTVGPFANVTLVTTSANHFPIGTLDCNGSGCHTTTNVTPGGFKLGTASISSPTLTVAGHATIAAAVSACQTCHETAPYTGMLAGTATTAGDSRPTALDKNHPTTGDCSGCHTTTPTFANDQTGSAEPANHIPTAAPCAQCHTTAGNDALYSVSGTHQGVTGCLTCHGPSVATTFANVTIVSAPANHMPIGTLDCNGSGCHSTTNVNPGGFLIGTASISSPTLTVAGHATIAAAVPACQTCHQTAAYVGMLASTATLAGDSRPSATLDALHPATGDCGSCHTTTPTFASDMTAGSLPSGHIPTAAACAQCHTTATNYAQYSVSGTHQGVSACLACHGPTVGPFLNVTLVSTPVNHFPIGTLDCNGSGCHSTTNVNPGGFKLGTANPSSPTLGAAGHTTVEAGVGACATCHETAAYLGMTPSTATTAGDSRPTALDPKHPATGDCGNCHVPTPLFATNLLPTVPKPANHVPTTAPCSQCHTTAGNFAVYDVVGLHQGVTACAACHGPSTGPFAGPPPGNTIAIVGWPGSSHIPIGTLDCNGSGCHTTTNVNSGGFKIGAASLTSPTLTVAGHTTIAGAVPACQTCHETAPYTGMIASTATLAGDSRPAATLDANHPGSGDCGGCHTTTPTFAGDLTASSKPSNHIPTTAACTQCHTTANNYTAYSVTGTHQGVTGCLTCHGPTVGPFANVTLVTTSASHIPIGTLDCNGSGCHSTTNVNPGGFKIGAASITAPTLTVAGHATIAGAVPACQTCHETAPYAGMIASTATVAGDSRPSATLDAIHPTTGDCSGCHTTTPTFVNDQTGNAKPSNHIPTTAPCAQCHTTAGNEAVYSVTGTHQGVTGCLTCHGPTVGPFANVTVVSTSASHFPIGTLDCNGSGCHSTLNVNPGGFKLGTASVSSPTLTVTGHTTIAAAVPACQTCHETAPYTGMLAGTATTAGDSRPAATLDKNHPTTGDCGGCHTTAPTFTTDQTGSAKPANHIPTTAACAQCHTTAGNDAVYSVTGTHQGVTGCLTCHGSTVATTFANVTIVTTPGNHMPIGALDCNGSGCHGTTNVSPGGFLIGAASITTPTLTVAGHTTIAGAVPACQTCHQSASYLGMIAGTATVAGDSRPSATLDAIHPTTGDCGACHSTTPTFAGDLTAGSKPSNHIPTTAACAQCHTTTGNYAAYSVAGTHQGVTGCLTCHGSGVGPFTNVTIVSTSASHFPIGTVDCNGSGCHSTANVNPGGFKLGTASISTPTLTVAGHTTIAGAVPACQTCHETAPYTGMVASTATVAGDSRPAATLDKSHPTTGDCGGCHTTAPTFTTDQTGSTKPANHIPTTAACAQCHTTAGNDALYSVTGTHQGVTGCLTCHGPTVATTFANITIVTTASNHMPIGSLDCNGSGCHTTTNVNPGGFKIGAASLTTPTLTVAGHTTIATAVSACQTCHETAPYIGMLASTATAAGDSRPTAFDKNHPTTGDCNGCHTTTPTFTTNQSGSSAKPSNHIPTTAACAQCHTTAGNYGAYVMGATGHTGISSNCAQCHAYGLSFYNMAAPTLKQPTSGATGHIPAVPPNGTKVIACELCHSPTVFTTFSGTVMKHATVTTMTCMSCHEYGMTWQTNTGVRLWTRPSPSHHAGVDCNGSGCHTSRDKMALRPAATPAPRATTTAAAATATGPAPRPGAATTASAAGTTAGPFNHATVAGQACLSCHNGTAATGKPASHLATTNNCQSCHTTLAWLPVATVDHSQVTGTCVSCHNGATATGKPSRHIATTAGCNSCHTTNGWVPARFDHAAVAPHTCNTCHNGVQAIGMARAHLPTTQSCDTCHGTLAWTPALIDHSSFVGSCARCHNNSAATGLPPNHFVTHLDCSSCHSYPDWSVSLFHHTAAAYPGDHRAALSCSSCHTTNTEQVVYSAPAYAGRCAGCHAKDYLPAAHPKTAARGGPSYTVGELANCSGACHVYGDASLTTIARSQPGPRHRITDRKF